MITFRDAPPTQPIPNVVRLSAAAARAALSEAGLVAVFVADGRPLTCAPVGAIVQVQVPSVGQLATPGSGVALYLS